MSVANVHDVEANAEGTMFAAVAVFCAHTPRKRPSLSLPLSLTLSLSERGRPLSE